MQFMFVITEDKEWINLRDADEINVEHIHKQNGLDVPLLTESAVIYRIFFFV